MFNKGHLSNGASREWNIASLTSESARCHQLVSIEHPEERSVLRMGSRSESGILEEMCRVRHGPQL